MSNFFEQAWIYDLVNQSAPGSAPISFYERAIERYGEPVLELASGTGEFLVTLAANSDIDISGTEKFSEPSVLARDKAERKEIETQIYEADMRNFELNRQFRLIFVAGNGLQHLKTHPEVVSCLASVKRHLKSGGRFIIEVFNPSVELLARDPRARFFVGEYRTAAGWIVIEATLRYDAARQLSHVDWFYRNQYSRSEQTISFTQRQFFPQELDALLELNGFRIEAKFGDFDESPFTAASPKQIIVAAPFPCD